MKKSNKHKKELAAIKEAMLDIIFSCSTHEEAVDKLIELGFIDMSVKLDGKSLIVLPQRKYDFPKDAVETDMKRLMDKCIKMEDYEQAAAIRDWIDKNC
jgi:hypothetical protein